MTFASRYPATIDIPHDHPLIYFHGRGDSSPGTWNGSDFKVNIENLKSFALNLGPHTTAPFASVGVSITGAPFSTFNASAGLNDIPLDVVTSLVTVNVAQTLVRINVEGSVSNRINLENITLNAVWAPVIGPTL
ncbi:hypothetical protein HYPSUDRAFT_202956 [Hypholoma sublateritium FD-334 SS-4]|uniref:Uncharacterized protein n=1 Tax=Hypholoma sublateritium (strain FD-334 SS-4) TaxID=945553 RepID=A0A0D2PNB4_HYPSF|nr:hypothetical protein HYPSUDRAFT_202956 [Hypholoma sublateritium FD-334 SS-4]